MYGFRAVEVLIPRALLSTLASMQVQRSCCGDDASSSKVFISVIGYARSGALHPLSIALQKLNSAHAIFATRNWFAERWRRAAHERTECVVLINENV